MVSRLLLLASVLMGSGCGGVISSMVIIQGTVALAGARAANAENLATYEYVSAEAYLKKAREAHSYADFEHSLRFARLAATRAAVAKKKALDANRPVEVTSAPESPAMDTATPAAVTAPPLPPDNSTVPITPVGGAPKIIIRQVPIQPSPPSSGGSASPTSPAPK